MVDLNHKQLQVVNHDKGPLLVLACPGSGKTRCITERIIKLLDSGVNKNSIIAVTFTNKAANEMAERIAAKGYNKLNISTFHSFCSKFLRKHAHILNYNSSYTICDQDSQERLIAKIVKNLDYDLTDDKFNTKYILSIIEHKKNNLIPDELFSLNTKSEYVKIFEFYQKMLFASNSMDFNDLIINTITILEQNDDLLKLYSKKYEHILIDEVQDTNKAQFKLVKLLASYHNNIIAVGDICQSIYGWRGADINNIKNFHNDFENAQIINLNINYRSTPEILKTAEKLILNNNGDLKEELVAINKSNNCEPLYTQYDDNYDEAYNIADIIMNHKWRNGIDYKNMAILCRTNSMTRVFETIFREKSIPYLLIGSHGFYDRKEVKDALAFMKFLSNNDDILSFERIINIPPKGIGIATLLKISKYKNDNNVTLLEACINADDIDGITKNARKVLKNIANMVSQFNHYNPLESINDIFEYSGFLDYYRSNDRKNNEHREDNIVELLKSLEHFCAKKLKPSLSQFLQEIALITSDDQDQINTDNAVNIMTCHAAKGLEFDVVFIPGLSETIFPHKRSILKKNLDEERRLCYVAMTRAKQYLYLSNSKNSAVSRFLVEAGFVDN